MNKYSLLSSVATVFAVVMSGMTSVMAETTTGTMIVGARTAARCTTPGFFNVITLGNYNGTSAVSGTANITFKCTNTTPFKIELTPGATGRVSTNGTLKRVSFSRNPRTIDYTLNSATFTGNGKGLTDGAGEVGATVTVNVAAGQNPVPGIYGDVIAIEVTY